MTMFERDTAEPIRELSHDEAARYLEYVGDDPMGYVQRGFFDPGVPGVVYAI
jgi:hypothetical protein